MNYDDNDLDENLLVPEVKDEIEETQELSLIYVGQLLVMLYFMKRKNLSIQEWYRKRYKVEQYIIIHRQNLMRYVQ